VACDGGREERKKERRRRRRRLRLARRIRSRAWKLPEAAAKQVVVVVVLDWDSMNSRPARSPYRAGKTAHSYFVFAGRLWARPIQIMPGC
jgi:hypothetical protein